jgi:hypothetical protein
MTITGKYHGAYDAKQVSDNLTTREFFIDVTTNPAYPNYIKFQLKNSICPLVDTLAMGEKIEVEFNIDGRTFTNKDSQWDVIQNLNAYKISRVLTQDVSQKATSPAPAPAPIAPPVVAPVVSGGPRATVPGNLPF